MISTPSFRDSDRIVARGLFSVVMVQSILTENGLELVRNIKRGIKRCMVDWTDCT